LPKRCGKCWMGTISKIEMAIAKQDNKQ